MFINEIACNVVPNKMKEAFTMLLDTRSEVEVHMMMDILGFSCLTPQISADLIELYFNSIDFQYTEFNYSDKSAQDIIKTLQKNILGYINAVDYYSDPKSCVDVIVQSLICIQHEREKEHGIAYEYVNAILALFKMLNEKHANIMTRIKDQYGNNLLMLLVRAIHLDQTKQYVELFKGSRYKLLNEFSNGSVFALIPIFKYLIDDCGVSPTESNNVGDCFIRYVSLEYVHGEETDEDA